jgi:hypothetical protein
VNLGGQISPSSAYFHLVPLIRVKASRTSATKCLLVSTTLLIEPASRGLWSPEQMVRYQIEKLFLTSSDIIEALDTFPEVVPADPMRSSYTSPLPAPPHCGDIFPVSHM